MNLKEIHARPLELASNFERTNLIIEEPVNQAPNQRGEYDNSIFSIPTAVPALVGAMFIFLGIKFNKIIQKRIGNFDKVSQKLPCANCQFFENNPYLKCAVQPELVLKKGANNCKDYQPLSEDESDTNES